MVGEYCWDCWLGECDHVRIAHVRPVSVVDCRCCRLAHKLTDAQEKPLLSAASAAPEPDRLGPNGNKT